MKKIILKTMCVWIFAIILAVSVNLKQVSAADFNVTNGGHTFSKAWETTTYFNGSSKLVYGYNTFLINEDYSHSNKKYSQAYLTNANGTFKGKAAFTTSWSKIEVTHAGNNIIYGVIY